VQCTIEALGTGGFGPRQNGSKWVAHCPAHDDRVASLCIAEGKDGRVLLKCHAGCRTAAVVAALGLDLRDLFEHRASTARETRYEIRDSSGALVATHVRRDGPEGKRFHWERDGQAGLRGLAVTSLPVYCSELVASTEGVVVLVEGEKACDALRRHGFNAVATVCGAGTTPESDALAALRGRHVVLWPDADEPGRGHMRRVGGHLAGIAGSVEVFEWVGGSEHGDAHDYFARGGTAETLRGELASAVSLAGWKPEPPSGLATLRTVESVSLPQGRGLSLADPEPWGEPVDGAKLADNVRGTLLRFLWLPPLADVAVTLWILFAHALDAFQVSPLLVATSPTKRCGKTTLLDLLSALVPRPLMTSNVSPAAIYRTVEKYRPTLLVDEADAFFRLDDEVRGLINAGHTRTGAIVVRMVGKSFEPRAFSTWSAKAIGVIGRLPDTLEDRAVMVPMARRAPGEPLDRLRRDRLGEFEPLRRQAARWAKDQHDALRQADPDVPQQLDDRGADNWRPLFAVADALGGMWPARAREAALALVGLKPGTDNLGEQLLADIRAVFRMRHDPEQLPSEALVSALVELEDRPWADLRDGKPITKTAMARLLGPFGIRPRTIRFANSHVARGYLLSDCEDAFRRYLPQYQVLQPLQDAKGAVEAPIPEVQQDEGVADLEVASEPRRSPSVAAVAHEEAINRAAQSSAGAGPVADFLARLEAGAT
jgi:putative DNA primase/helicase